jgi:putative hydrolase of the HAD superfamily
MHLAPPASVAKPISAILFDRDGVLTYFDTAGAAEYFRPLLPISIFARASRWQVAGAKRGFPRNLAEERAFFGEFWSEVATEFSLDAAQCASLTAVDYTQFIVAYPEVEEALKQLRAQNVRLGVLSNFSLASLDHSLVSVGLGDYFDVVCAAPVIGASKPSAKAYQIALDALQVKPEQCLFFDDEWECVEGARLVGMRAFLVDRHAPSTDWRQRIVTDLLEVPALVARTSR